MDRKIEHNCCMATKAVLNIDEISILVKKLRETIEGNGIHIDTIFLFGSYAKQKQNPDSDIDICIVSRDFGLDCVDEMAKLISWSWPISTKLEPYPVSWSDYVTEATPFISEIKHNSIIIA